jgi:multimeric flavodoxin WrbA
MEEGRKVVSLGVQKLMRFGGDGHRGLSENWKYWAPSRGEQKVASGLDLGVLVERIYKRRNQMGRENMKVLGICFSHRKGGNSEILLDEALRGARDAGAEVELISIRKMSIEPCNGCGLCVSEGVCSIKDDMQEVYPKMLSADGLILATPVYFWSLPGGGKCFLDRTYALRFPKLQLMNKAGAAITVASSSGNIEALSTLNMYFLTNHMITTDYVAGYAMTRKTIRKHKHAMLSSYELGRLVSSIINNELRYPEEFNRPIYSFVREKYGVHQSPYENL